MAKADIRASPRVISTSPARTSGRDANWPPSMLKSASAESSFRASPRASAMGSQSVGLGGNLGSSEDHDARGICEMGDQDRPIFQARTAGRESLRQTFLELAPDARRVDVP